MAGAGAILGKMASGGGNSLELTANPTAKAGGNDTGSINISPTALNLGEIIKPYIEGSERNGAISDPSDIATRYLNRSPTSDYFPSGISAGLKKSVPVLAIVGGGVGLYFLIKKFRR